MEISTFDDDLLGLSGFAERLEKFISVEHNFVEGSLVIALSSKYGSGKTTFLQMWKSAMENSEDEAEKPLVIDLNAWESDYYGDPLFAIVSALIERLQTEGIPSESLVNAAKSLGWFATAIAGQVVKKAIGIDAIAAGDFAEKKKANIKENVNIPADAFSIYQGRKNAMEHLKNAIREFVKASKPSVLFLVDELDRCRPDYAVSYLETIKHIFDISGAVFLLAADRRQLESSAKTAFGQGLDFEEYYRKFIHREITLPPISDSGYQDLASKYVLYYFERGDLRSCYMKIGSQSVNTIVELLSALKLTPRQVQDVFRILGHIFEVPKEREGNMSWCWASGTIAMAGFKVSGSKIYNLLGSQTLKPREAFDFLNTILLDEQVLQWWFELLFTGRGFSEGAGETAAEVMKEAGFIQAEEESRWAQDLQQMYRNWGHSSTNKFIDLKDRIEQISQWS